ncbi:hypothetical protein DMJ13_26405 [halophilic archaeon]|nr:hypothetical protein DMJ13_26405 [halophilic archaeon]
MDIGVLPVLLSDQPLDETLEYLSGLEVGTVELGCSGNPGDDHLSRMSTSLTKPPKTNCTTASQNTTSAP